MSTTHDAKTFNTSQVFLFDFHVSQPLPPPPSSDNITTSNCSIDSTVADTYLLPKDRRDVFGHAVISNRLNWTLQAKTK